MAGTLTPDKQEAIKELTAMDEHQWTPTHNNLMFIWQSIDWNELDEWDTTELTNAFQAVNELLDELIKINMGENATP